MKRSFLLLSLFLLAMLGGCATTPAVPPITLDEVMSLSKANTPPDEIVRKMKESRTVYLISASEIVKLSKEGVDNKVLDYMQATAVDQARRDERYHGYAGYPYPYYSPFYHRHPFWPYW
jgi:hypothetical protein